MSKSSNKITEKHSVASIVLMVLLIIYIVLLVAPYLWGFVASFKGVLDFDDNKMGLPSKWEIGNYKDGLAQMEYLYKGKDYRQTFTFFDMMGNSFVYTIVATLSTTLSTLLMAYASSMFKFKFASVIDVIVLSTMAIPIIGNMASSLWVFKTLNLYENFFGMTVVAKFSFLNMYYFVMKAYIKSLPTALPEAAKLDGCNNLQLMFKVILPLALPAVMTVCLINFIGYWNDWQTPYVYLSNFPTAAFGLYYFKETTNAHTTVILAGVMCVALPVLILFAFFNKRLLQGISLAGGVKE